MASYRLYNESVLLCDSDNNSIRIIKENRVSTYAGSSTAGYKDGLANETLLNDPIGLAYSNDALYINNKALLISNSGLIYNITGTVGAKIKFSESSTTDISNFDTIFVDSTGNRIYAITKGVVYTYDGESWKESELTQ